MCLLDLVLGRAPSVLAQTENGVVVLGLPVLALALEHHGVLSLADLAIVLGLDLLGGVGGLDTLILGEGALVSLSAGVGEEVRANGLDGAVLGGGDARDGLEVLLGSPAAGERRKGRVDLDGSHCDVYGCSEEG